MTEHDLGHTITRPPREYKGALGKDDEFEFNDVESSLDVDKMKLEGWGESVAKAEDGFLFRRSKIYLPRSFQSAEHVASDE